jgi:NADH-quinone oxidoreductase subunit C
VSDAATPTDSDTNEPGTDSVGDMVFGCPATFHLHQLVLYPSRERYLETIKAVADYGFHMVVDLCAVDHLENATRALPDDVDPERFEVVVNMLDMAQKRRIRIRVQVPANDPTVVSLFDLFPGTEAMEREAFDMFGIGFSGHPDLTRILMPEDWIGHPLRKDYDVGRIPVQFKEAHA